MQVNVISKTIISFIEETTRLMNAGKFVSSRTTRVCICKYYIDYNLSCIRIIYILDLKSLQTMSIFCPTYLRLVCFFLGVAMALFVPEPSEAVDNRWAKWAIVMRDVYLLNWENVSRGIRSKQTQRHIPIP